MSAPVVSLCSPVNSIRVLYIVERAISKSASILVCCVGPVLGRRGGPLTARASEQHQQSSDRVALCTSELGLLHVRVAALADDLSSGQEALCCQLPCCRLQAAAHFGCVLVCCVLFAGALERNLAPMVATDTVPETKPRPVSVGVSGVAFPHPEKVSRPAHAAVELCCRSSSCLSLSNSGAGNAVCLVGLHLAVCRGGCS